MSASEIFIVVLMGIIGLQMFFMHLMITASLKTMQSCSDTSDKAFDLTFRALDELVAVKGTSEHTSTHQPGGDQ